MSLAIGYVLLVQTNAEQAKTGQVCVLNPGVGVGYGSMDSQLRTSCEAGDVVVISVGADDLPTLVDATARMCDFGKAIIRTNDVTIACTYMGKLRNDAQTN